MNRFLPAICFLLFALPAWGQDIILPAKVEGEPGIPIPISAKYSGKNVVWKTPDKGLTVVDGGFFNGDSGKALLFGNAGTYRLWAFTAKGDVVSSAECMVVIGGGPTPPPPPPPTPTVQTKIYVVAVTPAGFNDAVYKADAALNARVGFQGGTLNFVPVTSTDPAWSTYVNEAKTQPLPWVFVIDADGNPLFRGPLPATPAELLKQIQQVGG